VLLFAWLPPLFFTLLWPLFQVAVDQWLGVVVTIAVGS
jgi:hypothetical protein